MSGRGTVVGSNTIARTHHQGLLLGGHIPQMIRESPAFDFVCVMGLEVDYICLGIDAQICLCVADFVIFFFAGTRAQIYRNVLQYLDDN